jgi:hypothetical protein
VALFYVAALIASLSLPASDLVNLLSLPAVLSQNRSVT